MFNKIQSLNTVFRYFCRSAPLISFNFDSILQQAYSLSTPIYKSHKTNKATSFGEQRGSHSFILLPEHSASERSCQCQVTAQCCPTPYVHTWLAHFGLRLPLYTAQNCCLTLSLTVAPDRTHMLLLHQLFSICVSALGSSLFLALLLISFA